jgi:hypothetical protein
VLSHRLPFLLFSVAVDELADRYDPRRSAAFRRSSELGDKIADNIVDIELRLGCNAT